MEDHFDKAINAMKERTEVREEEQRQTRQAITAQQPTDEELLRRWHNTHEKFAKPNLLKLQSAMAKAGYSKIKMESGLPTPSGFVQRLSGVNPDNGKVRSVTLNYMTVPVRMAGIPWQQLQIESNVRKVNGTFGPDMEEKNFKEHVWSLFF